HTLKVSSNHIPLAPSSSTRRKPPTSVMRSTSQGANSSNSFSVFTVCWSPVVRHRLRLTRPPPVLHTNLAPRGCGELQRILRLVKPLVYFLHRTSTSGATLTAQATTPGLRGHGGILRAFSNNWFDVLVQAKEIRRIVLVLQPDQALEIHSVGSFHAVVAFVHQEVYVGSSC